MKEEDRGGERATVWLVVGEKRGDNAQVHNLARRAGLDGLAVEKFFAIKPEWVDAKPPVAVSLDHVDREKSDALEGPWPDLVVCAGRRLASVALWIKEASGGRTRLVVVGKPRGQAASFDLIVAADHYVLPDAPNVARHGYPLMELDHEALAETKKAWVGRLTLAPRPLTALFVGGPTGGLRFGVEEARALHADARRLVAEHRGSLYIVTSRRTPAAIVDYFREAKEPDPNEQLAVYDASLAAIDNPYRGLLALADHFVVTTDSLSMMVEVAQLGRPLSLFALGRAPSAIERVLEGARLLRPVDPTRDAIPAGGVVARTMAALGRPIHSRDLTATARRLVADGFAAWSTDPMPTASRWVDEALVGAVRRVRALAGLED
ncbi:MAG: mitochondrial fission ELM1 family protein [bacterium]|nr:mitochondrial fission ELM1 family protein [bacterium]